MTEKDYHKIINFKFKEVEFLKVTLEINDKKKFISKVMNLYAKNN